MCLQLEAKELFKEEHLEFFNVELPHPFHHLLDHPDKTRELNITSKRKAQVRLLSSYKDEICRILHDTLKWMRKKNLHPKLEGRYVNLLFLNVWDLQ